MGETKLPYQHYANYSELPKLPKLPDVHLDRQHQSSDNPPI